MEIKNGMKVISTITRGNYLRKGNEYIVKNVKESTTHKYSFDIIDDSGFELFCLLEKCSHLKGDNWIIKQ